MEFEYLRLCQKAMESERSEATFEGLAAIPSELIEAEQNVSAEGEAFDASSVTHAMITPISLPKFRQVLGLTEIYNFLAMIY